MSLDLIAEPSRVARLPHDRHGRPIPWFAAWVDGVPDFRIVKPGAVAEAVSSRLCWVCGVAFLRQEPRASVIGPMCIVNLNTAEPPCHEECATYSARACPFLATPRMIRRERHLPPGTALPPGEFLGRNPGVAAVWVTKYNATKVEPQPEGGVLFRLGSPLYVEWWAEGRRATHSEVMASIDSGMPSLADMAEGDPEALRFLDAAYQAALRWVPK